MQTLYNELGKYFDAIAAASSIDTKKEVTFLQNLFTEHNVHSVLDVACGTGRHSVALAKAGYNVTGIDYATELLKVARSKSDAPNMQFIQQDVAAIKLDQTFDAAICMWSTFGELPYKEMLRGLRSALKPGGLFIIDMTYFVAIPTGVAHKTYTNKTDGVTVRSEIDEIYTGRTRVREIVNVVNGKTFKDHSEMDVFTEADLIKLLEQHGFRHTITYYDYSSDTQESAKRIQLVFHRSN